MFNHSNSQNQLQNQNTKHIQIIENDQNDISNAQKQTRRQSLALIPDPEKKDAEARVDFIQDEGGQQRSTLRILNDADMQLSPKYAAFSSFPTNKQQSINMQNFSKAVQSMKNNSYKLLEKQEQIRNKFVKKKMANVNRQDEFTPYSRHVEKEFSQNVTDDRQIFEELDEWKHEVDHIKRIENYTHQLLVQQSSKNEKKRSINPSSQNTEKRSSYGINPSNIATKETVSSKRSSLEEGEQNNTTEIVQQMIEIHNKIQQEEEIDNPISSRSSQTGKYRFHSQLQDRAIHQEPKVNEMILNSIMNVDEVIQNSNGKQRRIIEANSPRSTPKHLLSNGASPQMRKEIKSKFTKYQDESSTSKLSSSNLKSVAFKENISTQKEQPNQDLSKHKEKIFEMPKKTTKQILSETNEMLIEKLFLMKLKKKIEPIHQEQINHLKHRFLMKLTEKNKNNVGITEEIKFENSSKSNRPNSTNKTYQVLHQEVFNEQVPMSKTFTKGFQIKQQNNDNQSMNSRCSSPQQNEERQHPGFLSQREERNPSTHFNNKILQQQHEIVKDEIENFQKKTLESFKFIQEMKRTRTGTPQLMNLVSGRKVGDLDNQSKTEKYIKHLEKEFSLNSVKQSVQITKQWTENGKNTPINDSTQQRLLELYKSTLSRIREKKDQLENYRLESFRLQSVINQIQEEKKQMHSRMIDELERTALQKYSMLSIQFSGENQQPNTTLRAKHKQKQTSQKSLAHISSQIYEQQENIRHDFDNRQRSLSSKISKLKQNVQENSITTANICDELQHLKNTKVSTKKQLKDYYLSLLQQNKGNENPQISIISLIEQMQGIGEEVNEKMLPNYFDDHNINFVKKLQELTFSLEKLQEELQIVQKSTKNSIHSQIQLSKLQSQQELGSQPEILPTSSALNSTRKQSGVNIDLQKQLSSKNNQNLSLPISNIQSTPGLFSSSMLSQQQLSNRNWDDEDKKLLKLMLGNEINHKKEIKKKLERISKNTLQTKQQASNSYYSPNYIEEDTNQDSTVSNDKLKINLKNGNQQNNPQEKSDDENYFFLNTLKRGSLSVLDYQKKIFEHIQEIQQEIQSLKEQELDRIIKQYNNILAEDRIQNVKKIFILMYGNYEGNIWFSKFTKRRRDVQLKSQANKTFNFQEILFSKSSGGVEQPGHQAVNQKEDEMLQKINQQEQSKVEKRPASKSNQLQREQNNMRISNERKKVQQNFKRLQNESENLKLNWTMNEMFFKDPFQTLSKLKQSESSTKSIDKIAIQLKASGNITDQITSKPSKSVHFQQSEQFQQKEGYYQQGQSHVPYQILPTHKRYSSTSSLASQKLNLYQS